MGNRKRGKSQLGGGSHSRIGAVRRLVPDDAPASRGGSQGGPSEIIFDTAGELAKDGSVPPDCSRSMDVDPSVSGGGCPHNRPPSPPVGGKPAGRRMRANPQADVMGMDQGTSALDHEACEFPDCYAAQPPPSPETRPPQTSRPCDFQAVLNNPMGR